MSSPNVGRRKRALIVTASYAPTMIADMQRARVLAWQLPDHRWDVEILAPDISYQPSACNDADGAEFFSPAVKVHFAQAWLPWLFQSLRSRDLGLRALVPLYLAGAKLLATRRFDVVYFSTAQTAIFLLGAAWWRRFKIPYVIDLHDPIAPGSGTARRGSKQRLSRYLSAGVERYAVASASGLIAVSPRYIEVIRAKYARGKPPWLKPGCSAFVPFGVLPHDLDAARRSAGNGHGKEHDASEPKRIVYVGTGGPIMARSVGLLCRILAEMRQRDPRLLRDVHIELYGTAGVYAANPEAFLADLAAKYGAGDIIAEYPDRVTYRRSLELLQRCGGALVLGVDDAGYMPSKLVTYLYSGKPLLACVHRDGPAFAMLRALSAPGHVLWFSDKEEMPMNEAIGVVARFLGEVKTGMTFDRRAELAPYTAMAMADRHARLFDACLA